MTRNPTEREGIDLAPKRLRSARWRVVALASILLLPLGCLDGGDFAATGGMSGTGISQGSISGFGSIFVNGVEWELDSSSFEIDGDATKGEADLRLGMVVRIEGRRGASGDVGDAVSVVFDDAVEGPIENMSDTGGGVREFDVLGIHVTISDVNTVYDDGATFGDLADDDVVEVSGFVDELGGVQATRVELVGLFPGDAEAELKGTIMGLDTLTTNSFLLGSVLIHYDESMTEFEDLADENDLFDGLFVEVKGTLRQLDELDAEKIEREDEGLGVDDSEDVELEGIVTNLASPTSFWVAGVEVDASQSPTLDPPGLIVAAGDHVEVEGRLVGGVLIADEIESEEEDDQDHSARIRAQVESLDSASRSVVLLGVVVRADGDTELKDERDPKVEMFRFEDIAVDDWLEIEGGQEGFAAVLASKIERDDPENDVVLRGPVTAFDDIALTFEILDQPVPINPLTEYRDSLDNAQDENWFFSQDRIGAIVKAVDKDALSLDALDEVDEVDLED